MGVVLRLMDLCVYIYLSMTKDEDSSAIMFLFTAPVGKWPDKTRSPQTTGENLTERPTAEKQPFFGRWRKPTQAFLTSRASLPKTTFRWGGKSGLHTILNGRCRETAAQRCVTFIWITLRRSTHQNQPLSTCAWHMAVYLDQIPSIPPCC